MILSKAIRKYGWQAFDWEILCKCNDKLTLNLMETFKIMVNHSHYTDYGYNVTWGGDGISGFKWSEESKQKQRERNLGKTLTVQHKINISKGLKGKYKKYDDYVIEKSIKYRNDGMMFTEISKEMNIPVETIKWWYKKAGL
jgi:hypothetical protein